jgi:hypothetical protein
MQKMASVRFVDEYTRMKQATSGRESVLTGKQNK